MNVLLHAAKLDAADQPVAAADAYEHAIGVRIGGLEPYRNLVPLYIASLDPGYAAAHYLSTDFISRAARRIPILIQEAIARFGEDTELDFWGRYYRFKVLGDEWDIVFPESYAKIVEKGKSLVPYFALFLSGSGKQHAEKLEALVESTRSGATLRERELYSISASALEKYQRKGS